MIIHTIIKMHYTRLGYLPNHPYHLISDEEMFNAFIENETNYFDDMYYCEYESLQPALDELKAAIRYHIQKHIESELESYVIPDWVYSYMMGTTITHSSEQLDRHDLLTLMNLDNLDDELTEEVMTYIYSVSKKWIAKLSSSKNDHRPPTIFGEPHVIKYLRLQEVGGIIG